MIRLFSCCYTSPSLTELPTSTIDVGSTVNGNTSSQAVSHATQPIFEESQASSLCSAELKTSISTPVLLSTVQPAPAPLTSDPKPDLTI